jgi:biotin transport system substrate-specific component
MESERTGMGAAAMARVALMAALTAVGAQLSIPLPFTPVPFTLQVPMVVLSGLLLGARYGALSQVVYLVLGAAGLPVFAKFSAGLGIILGPTGGYLVSYPFAAAVAGLAAATVATGTRGRAIASGTASGLLALLIIYAVGAAWLAVQAKLTPEAAVVAGVLPFVPFDVVKVVLAVLLAAAAAPQISPGAKRSSP